MSHDEIHHDSLLSSISNISVKIDHTEIDDPGFFTQNPHPSLDQHQIHCEVDIDDLEDDQDIDPASLVKQIYYSYRGQQVGSERHEAIEPWVRKQEEGGVSEEEGEDMLEEQFAGKEVKEEAINVEIHIQNGHDQERSKRQMLQQQKRLKNETKNIPKNYGKAIITFIQKYETKVRQILSHQNVDYDSFILQLRHKKRVINTIADLRNMWLDYDHAQSMRVLSNLFLRKYALSYIFNSRICNYSSHIKYRYRLTDAIKEPGLFKHIKDY